MGRPHQILLIETVWCTLNNRKSRRKTSGSSCIVSTLYDGLDVGIVESHLGVGYKLFNFLLLALGANEQHVVGLGNDVVLQPLDNHQFVALHGNDVVCGVVEQGLASLGHVAVFVFGRVVIQGAPRTQVAPAEVGTENEYVRGLLHHTKVDRNVGTSRKILVDKLFLGRRIEYLVMLFEPVGNIGQESLEGVDNRLYIPDKYTRVPEEFAALDKHLGKLEVGFLGKGLYRFDVTLGILANLYVAISRFGSVGLYTQCEQSRIFSYEFETLIYSAGKLILLENEVIGGSHHDVGLGVDCPDMIRGPGNTRSRVAASRL